MERHAKISIRVTRKQREDVTRFAIKKEMKLNVLVTKATASMLMDLLAIKSHHVNSLRMEDVTKNVPTTAQKLCVLVHQSTSNSEQIENLVKRFTHATNQITVDVLINVPKKKKMLNVVVMKDVN